MSVPLVLVHGATAGGWIWRPTLSHLRRAGYEVFTPTLTGLGEREHLLRPDVDLTTHVTDVVNTLAFNDLERVVLVGHSYGGMVISGAAEAAAERLEHLVFLDAVVPEHGQAFIDLYDPPVWEATRRYIDETGQGWLYLPTGEVKPHQRPHPVRAFTEALTLQDSAAADLPRTYIHCTGKDAADPVFQGVERSAQKVRREGWRFVELATGHEPMWTDPERLAEVVLQLAS